MSAHAAPGGTRVMPLMGEHAVLGEALAAAGAQFGDRDAYVEGGDRLSYAEWDRRASALAARLDGRGVRRGDVVALMLPPGIDYAVCYAAVVRIGAVVTGLNTRLGPAETGAILERCVPALVIRDGDAGLPEPPAGLPVLPRSELAGTWRDPAPDGGPWDVQPDDPAVIIWTSGTTGTPKGAWYDHRGLAAAARSSGVMSAPFDRRLSSTPFAHAGYMGKVWDQIAWGVTLVLGPARWSAGEMRDLLRRERITVAGGVPTQWAKLLEASGAGGADAPSAFPDLRLGVSATAPAAPDLVERVGAVLGVPLIVRYAMTESPSISGTAPEDPPEIQFRTVGRPQEGMEVVAVDADGRRLPPGEVGEIRVRGACVMRGYWRDPERTGAAFDDAGWLRTGDLGSVTEEGYLALVGRSGDMYIRGGYNVHPLQVENVLGTHPKVARVAVVGAPAPVIGEIGVAFAVPADPSDPPDLAELRSWAEERLADYKAPDTLVLLDELPLTPMAKVDRAALRARAATIRERNKTIMTTQPRPCATGATGESAR
ncbi:class I adenylate-forming enzyme family protein [Actinomadura sp. SCN-SB]|uniref:class I adenylate-forming enzyme family protein n=1 Tax=Actinomadura sp. SCN-SB TaxID=3373092 RepID=UPI0037528356